MCFFLRFNFGISRWDVIAEYVNHHSKGTAVKTSKHVIKKVKELQKFGEDVNKQALTLDHVETSWLCQ